MMISNCSTVDNVFDPAWAWGDVKLSPSKEIIDEHYTPPKTTNILSLFRQEMWSSVTKALSGVARELVFVGTETLDSQTIKVLGDNGAKRFDLFKQYKKGWDAGRGLPLSLTSVAVMESFVRLFNKFETEPSLFLTAEGNMQLGWEDKDEQIIEVEFFADRIEYYIESLDEELVIPLTYDEISKLTARLSDLS